ncbi:hypothetical protein BDV23DRAFT_183610 [Aspergillus alliaceus]|uniref:Uncharacterized protein n=1 Tax=Petromyces alliaceus TaxID=209559 RepID=A0A5N7C927_PETAA|nr:hypothetical protein BDV23DRAFT_183610 [Aspergillus alliaceus]
MTYLVPSAFNNTTPVFVLHHIVDNHLHEAAARVSEVLLYMSVSHAFIGGYATTLLCGHRMTEQPGFYTSKLCLMYQPGQAENPAVKCDILCGGATEQLRLPSAATVQVVNVNSLRHGLNVPVVHQRVLILTKVKRWAMIRTSRNPRTEKKRETDEIDAVELLRWLLKHKMKIDFDEYTERPKALTISNVQAFYHLAERGAQVRLLLEKALEQKDFEIVKGPFASEDI